MKAKVIAAFVAVAMIGGAVAGVLALFGADDEPRPEALTAEEVGILAMHTLQRATAEQMRHFVNEGAFFDDPARLAPVAEEGGLFLVSTLEVCERRTVAVLGTDTPDGRTFAVRVQGLEPPEEGEAEIGHFTSVPACEAAGGPGSWPGGYRITREGLMKGDAVVDTAVS